MANCLEENRETCGRGLRGHRDDFALLQLSTARTKQNEMQQIYNSV